MESKSTLEISDWRFPNHASDEDRLIALEFVKDVPGTDIVNENINIAFRWRIYKSEIVLEFQDNKIMLSVFRWVEPMDYCKDYIEMKLEDPKCTPQFVRAKIMEAINDEEEFNHDLADEYRNQQQKEA
jgi:hypothetical protein